jgi:uncharacterized protein with NRDE domain
MCTIFFALNNHPTYSFILAGNRDEFYDRPTMSAAWWEDAPHVLGGRDLEAGGTWMGLTQQGRFAALTNYRAPSEMRPNAVSRGILASNFLIGNEDPRTYLTHLHERSEAYNAFNLLIFDGSDFRWYNPKDGAWVRIRRGVYTLSNAYLNTNWPKTAKGKNEFQQILTAPELQAKDFWPMLSDRAPAADALLPDTGVGLEMERMLSSVFIKSPRYGTRMQTVILVRKDGHVSFTERTFHPQTETFTTVSFEFQQTK